MYPRPPTKNEFEKARRAFDSPGTFGRDPTYKTGRRLVETYRNSVSELADGLGVVLVHWNHAFYRYGRPDFEALQGCLMKHRKSLARLDAKDLVLATPKDLLLARTLFDEFIEALAGINRKTGNRRRSAVATAKALHLLAPSFFPLWDENIASAYKCSYGREPGAAYMRFSNITKDLLIHLDSIGAGFPADGRTRLKALDEFNFVTYVAPKVYGV